MPDDLLQAPHVHEWRHRHVDGRPFRGQVNDTTDPIVCACGESAGDWARVPVNLSFDVNVTMPVAEVWPDKRPAIVTAAAVAQLLERLGRQEVLIDWCLLPYPLEIDIDVAGTHAVARLG